MKKVKCLQQSANFMKIKDRIINCLIYENKVKTLRRKCQNYEKKLAILQ